ncbi:hypothetical protein KSP40_PGU001957 [Platanthera guangdongensis]|uniref:Uncharacterized protein n=1 Tax=Platanthera guangdongensis TaxID=2320717 RepID=A0ABR2LVE0_9ASPA
MEMRLLVAILEISKNPAESVVGPRGIVGADIPAAEILLKTKELRQRYLIPEEEILNKTRKLRENYEQTRARSICRPAEVLSTCFEISDQIWGNDFISKEKKKKEDERKRKGKEKVIDENWG